MENFSELISRHLLSLMDKVEKEQGKDSRAYRALYYQYVKTETEEIANPEHNAKHYEAIVNENKSGLRYVERLYKRQATIDLTKACSAHCRYCLRQNYSGIHMTESDRDEIIQYLSQDSFLKEVLITGGDPLLDYEKLLWMMKEIIEKAPNIRILRIGTRLPVQSPLLLNDKVLEFISKNKNRVAFEIALQINHVIEFQSETEACVKALQDAGATFYAQNVLLKNVNDNLDDLINLYDLLRYQHIEAHYLFHPVPIARTAEFRMPLSEFMKFAVGLTASGEIPGRSKPMFSVMTDVGKCTLYEGTLGEKQNGYYEIKTGYRYEDRLKWNSGYSLPQSARIDSDGVIVVKYLDGHE